MIDLHTHILHGIDDGAKTIEDSLALLRAEIKCGVHTVALTPHFKVGARKQADFIDRRKKAFEILVSKVQELAMPIHLILGAEVAYSPELLNIDLDDLCYENTRTILIEMPLYNYPSLAGDVFFKLMLEGYTPLIAHAERYHYFANTPDLLEGLVNSGVLIQVNAEGLLSRWSARKRRILRMISDGLVDVLATDAHSMEKRPPLLDKSIKVVAKKFGDEMAQDLANFEL